MAKISNKISESLSEYLVLTGWIKTKPEHVSLQTKLGHITLQYPFMTSRMQCIVGPELAITAGRQGILTMIPRSLRDEDKQAIIDANNHARLKKGDIEFQENPEFVYPESTFEEVIKKVERTGYSVIPILDRKSKLYGFYIHDPDNLPLVPPKTPIIKVMKKLREHGNEGIPFLINNEDKDKIQEILSKEEIKFLPIVNENMTLQKIAFFQRFDTNFIGIAIATREGWKDEIEKWGPQVDTLCIDSSNACFDDALKILRYAKTRFPDKPFGIGNIIKGEDFKIFAQAGADYILGGMGVGSFCQTGSRRGNGRGQMTVAIELARARDEFFEETGRYVLFVLDGGIDNIKDMTIALAFSDLIMMCNYFNRFIEAPAQKFDANKKPTSEEALVKYIETWAEGSLRARLVAMYGIDFKEKLSKENSGDSKNAVERYGHSSVSVATIEGVVGLVEARGRLKPCVEEDVRYIKTTIANTGATNLDEFRKLAIVERVSLATLRDMSLHDIEFTGYD